MTLNLRHMLSACIIILMCYSLQLLFTWPIPIVPFTIVCLLVLAPYLMSRNPENELGLNRLSLMSKSDAGVFVLLFVNIVYHEIYTVVPFSPLGFLVSFLTIFVTFCFTVSSADFIRQTYKYFDVFIKVLCCISLFGWLLFLLNFPLPHYEVETNKYYDHAVYYLFLFNIKEFEFLPRFAGMFLEPGHLGSTCCMLLFINRFNFKDRSNWIYVVSILLSFSLAAYCLLGIGLILYNYFTGKDVGKKLLFVFLLIFGVYMFGITVNDGDNEVNNLIISRLEIVDGGLAGDNRTAPVFDQFFRHWLEKGDIFLGFGPGRLLKYDGILLGTAGFKRYFFLHGIFGTITVFALYILLYWRNRSRLGMGFFILYLICNFIRDYPFKEMWLYLFIMAMYMFDEKNNPQIQLSEVTDHSQEDGVTSI